jgi:hypothetical protein
MCLLQSSYYTMHDCTINVDESSELYTCFDEYFSVVYDVFNGSQIQATIETKSEKKLLQFKVNLDVEILFFQILFDFIGAHSSHRATSLLQRSHFK